jgi:hypothetical protein
MTNYMKLPAACGNNLQKINVKDPEQLLFDGNQRSSLRITNYSWPGNLSWLSVDVYGLPPGRQTV